MKEIRDQIRLVKKGWEEGWRDGRGAKVGYLLYFLLLTTGLFYYQWYWGICAHIDTIRWFPRWFKLFLPKISITLTAKFALWFAKRGHANKQWLVSSISWLHSQILEGISAKLWNILWYLTGLKFTLNWKIYRSPKGSCTPKVLLALGRIRNRICAFRLAKGGTVWKFVIILFHKLIAAGKKLFLYL